MGDDLSRRKYKKVLKEYFNDLKSQLSSDSQLRLKNNPLRILDSKDRQDIELVKNAPKITHSLNDESKDFFS